MYIWTSGGPVGGGVGENLFLASDVISRMYDTFFFREHTQVWARARCFHVLDSIKSYLLNKFKWLWEWNGACNVNILVHKSNGRRMHKDASKFNGTNERLAQLRIRAISRMCIIFEYRFEHHFEALSTYRISMDTMRGKHVLYRRVSNHKNSQLQIHCKTVNLWAAPISDLMISNKMKMLDRKFIERKVF